jgi:hypothetical protein
VIDFSLKRRRAALHYTKKIKGKSPYNATNTIHPAPHTLTPQQKCYIRSHKKTHRVTTARLNISNYRGEGQSRMKALKPEP